MANKQFNWKNADNQEIFAQYWTPEEEPKAVIAMVHGMGEHSQRYEGWAKRFNKEGFAFTAIDHIGHGKTDGKRGHVKDYETLLATADKLIEKTAALFPDKPIFLYGHSMGGGVVLNYAIQNSSANIKGVIASSPWLKLAFDPPAIQVALGNLVKNILPSLTQSTKLDVNAISRDSEEVKKYSNDPLVHDRISTMFFTEAYQAGLDAIQHADKIKHPVLLFHGTSDQLTSYKASEELSKKVKAPIKFELFEGAYHEIHNDLDRDKLFQLILDWLNNHLS